MAAIDDAKVIIDTLTGGTLTNARILELVQAYLRLDGTEGWTNEQIAQAFLDQIKNDMKNRIRGNKRTLEINAVEPAIEAAVTDISSDF